MDCRRMREKVKKFLLWQYMLNKRLLHKKAFVLLLCLVPLLVWGMGRIAREDSGVMTILLSLEEPEDKLAMQLVEEILQEDSILRYEMAEPNEAYELVADGKADCAWIFREDFQEKLINTFTEEGEKVAPIYVVAQEDTVALQLAGTKLYGSVFPHLAQLLCRHFIENQVSEGENISEEELQAYYAVSGIEGDLFQVIYEGNGETGEMLDQSYLLTPIRGILAVFLLICGLVVTLYYLQDGERGMFAWIPVHKRRGLLYCYLFAAGLDMSVVAVLSLLVCGGKPVSLRELEILMLYLLMTAVFCELMKLLCRNKETLAKWIPLISLAMLGLCPIFLDLGSDFALQYLFPPTYYLRALQSDGVIPAMVGYTTLVFAAETICRRVVQRKAMY